MKVEFETFQYYIDDRLGGTGIKIVRIPDAKKQLTGSDLEEEKESNTKASETLEKEIDIDGDEIKFESFELLERVGKGSFGEVFKAIFKKDANKENPTEYALKAMKKQQIIYNNQLKYVISE